ncbi:hypothetical protein G2912_01110 [Paraburkholderia aspalathi]|uniref:SF3 helicase domain-containing protein n=1 Tax=Paraburkholderia nemoris TaxID=2793076 RepID=A0ABN7KTJ7_9BURK|nr:MULTISPECIES: phage/plasmid primase, P4 family [Paraburkholderia]MBK3808947.1 hypothetical protein [Paraburkholderia aspalathi]CAE6706165.1 hypothetical protein R69776_00876 [Paraburkholderia nemoris]
MSKEDDLSMEIKPDCEALAVCRAVHGESDPFTIKWIHRNGDGQKIVEVIHTYGTLSEQAVHFAGAQASGWEAFMLVGLTSGEDLSQGSVRGTWAVGVDLDYEVDMSRWRNASYRPSLATNTSGGRQHLIWIFRQAVDNARFRKMAVALAHRFEGDVCFANLTQAIRLPGFANRKRGNEVKLSLFEPDRYYNYEELVAAFDVELISASLQALIPMLTRSLGVKVATDDEKRQRLADLRDALKHIDPDAYDTWIKVIGAASSLGDDGFKLVDEWSRRSNKYDEQRMQIAWKSFAAGSSASPASIFYMAAQSHWSNPGFRKPVTGHREVLGERSIGRMLAAKMYPDIAVGRMGHGDKQTLQALRWQGERYEAQDQYQFRSCVESYCAEFARSSESDANPVLAAAISKHSGDNRALDLLGRAALEFMLDASDRLQATKYPYFPVANGVLNLLSRELVLARIRPIAHHHSPVTFDSDASAPRFEAFLAQIFEGDTELIRFFLRLLGYMLLGKPTEHLFVIFHGPTGRNGKSVTVEVLMAIFGRFACTLGVSAVMVKSTMTDGPTPSIAKLEGKRLVSINEPNSKHRLDAGLVKQLTGGDRVAARALYGAEIEFLPEFTPIMVANSLPKISSDDDAIWRRIIVIPFLRTFSDEEIDLELKDKLLAELSGILNLLLEGLRDYLENGLQSPEKVRMAGNEQRKLADGFEAWREERTVPVEGKTQHKFLYEDYVAWTLVNRNYEKLTSREFGAKLKAAYERRDERHNVFYVGISLKDVSGIGGK